MENEKIIIIQFRLTRTHRLLALALAFLCFHPRPLGSETLTLTAYYPAPYGGYVSLLTTRQTLLARDGGVVGIGTGTPDTAGTAKVDIVGGDVYVDTTMGIYSRGIMNIRGEGLLNLQNKGGTVVSKFAGGNGNLKIEGDLQVGTVSPLDATKVLNVCERKTYTLSSSESCKSGWTIVGFMGSRTSGVVQGFLPAHMDMSGTGTFIQIGQDWEGTFMCCKF